MGLLIKSTADKKIKISGTDFELEEVYGRIAFVGKANGIEMEIATSIYANEQMWLEGKLLYTDIPAVNFNAVLPEGQSQSIENALQQAKLGFEQLGYGCDVVQDSEQGIVDNINNNVDN